jgi:hypothetical protein
MQQLKNRLMELEVTCAGKDPCDFTFTGVNYWVAQKGKLKNSKLTVETLANGERR